MVQSDGRQEMVQQQRWQWGIAQQERQYSERQNGERHHSERQHGERQHGDTAQRVMAERDGQTAVAARLQGLGQQHSMVRDSKRMVVAVRGQMVVAARGCGGTVTTMVRV